MPYKNYVLNKNAHQPVVSELFDNDIIGMKSNGSMTGKKGVSTNPRWVNWDGNYYKNFQIRLSSKGLSMLKNTSIKNFEIAE